MPCLYSYYFSSLFRVVINEWLSIKKGKDPIGRDLCFCIVWSKSTSLTNSQGSKHESKQDSKYILEFSVKDMIRVQSHKKSTKSECNDVTKKDHPLRYAIGHPL